MAKNSGWRIFSARVAGSLLLAASLATWESAIVRADEPGQLVVKVDQPGVKISPMLYGLMTEEINHSYDGGLYGELIQNRIFKDNADKAVHWSVVNGPQGKGSIALDNSDPVNTVALTTALRLDIANAADGQRVGIANDGYWGIPARPSTTYTASFYARANEGFTGPLTVDLESDDGATVYASATVPSVGKAWQKYTATLTTDEKVTPSATNRFVISANKPGTVWFNLVSLFPPTFKNRANGNRIDLMQKLDDMHSAFLRLPGGNYLEGDTIKERFEWKDTLGPLEQRAGHPCPWGYRSSDGMGILEFLEWCEDLKIEPVLAVYAGYSLKGEHVNPGPDLEPFVQDAMDEVEYVTGDASTHWGQERAKEGHPAPFTLHYIEIGNEDWFDKSGSYSGRYKQFYDALKAKYPQYTMIATASVQSMKPDMIDEHFYRSARKMARDSRHYDKYDRSGPKIFVGEWASTEGNPTPTLQAALGDAAWMTGMERNSDIVLISSYAPLLVDVNKGGSQWGTNLIGFDAVSSFGSPSYYAQKMFNEHRGDTVLPVEVSAQKVAMPESPMPQGRIGLGTWLTSAEFKDIKVTQGEKVLYQADFSKGTKGWRFAHGKWSAENGALVESAIENNCRATTGGANWGDYTYTLKARKVKGEEGFLIMFHATDDENFTWWNVGGWGDTRTSLEQVTDGSTATLGEPSNVTVEPDRWYDVRIELKGRDIRCYLDDKLVTQATDDRAAPSPTIYATASRMDSNGDIILKVVNPSPVAQQLQIDLQGAGNVGSTAKAIVLAGEPKDVNTIAEPEKVAPKEQTISDASAKFVHEFPANSLTVITLSNAK